MRGLGVDLVEYDIEKDGARRAELIRLTGRTSIPVIDVEGTIIRGFDPNAIRTALDQHARQ